MKVEKTQTLLSLIRKGEPLTIGQQINLAFQLSLPAILAQLSTIVMEYIDASMVGHLGANQAASIGLISTSTWLFGGLCATISSGFSVQVAHFIGADDSANARRVLRQSITAVSVFCIVMAIVGLSISKGLPVWLGGTKEITGDATSYFLIFTLTLPAIGLNYLAGSMLRCSGNMKIPSLLNVLMCLLDVVFNALFIFPSQDYQIFGFSLHLPGAHLGVTGAALGTALAELITAILMMSYLVFRSNELKLTIDKGSFALKIDCLKRALHIGLPMACEHLIMCGAQIVSTIIVAPLGVLSIAANTFAITAESLCYMPGFGISDAATTLVGQSVGAKRIKLGKHFAHITIVMGMAVMTLMGVIMYITAPLMMAIMTPNIEIQNLGVMALRIEAFAEPMFAASIVTYGVFVGAGDTLIPSIMNLGSMWAIRLTLAAMLAPIWGLKGVWIAMCTELCFRGIIFLLKLNFSKFGYFSHKLSKAK